MEQRSWREPKTLSVKEFPWNKKEELSNPKDWYAVTFLEPWCMGRCIFSLETKEV